MFQADAIILVLCLLSLMLMHRLLVEVYAAAAATTVEGLVDFSDQHIVDGAESWQLDRGQV